MLHSVLKKLKMKQINKNTPLKQGDKTFQPVEVDGVIYWVDSYNLSEPYESRIKQGMPFYKDELNDILIAEYSPSSKVSRLVIAQSQPKIKGIPVISLDKCRKNIAHILLAKELLKKEGYHENSDTINYLNIAIKDIKELYSLTPKLSKL